MVYLRFDPEHMRIASDASEHPLAVCPSHQEARRIRRILQEASCDCVIRFVGTAGGGD
jgi:hypothetical protein